jgi:hypothetical protein
MSTAPAIPWLLLIHQLPPKPAYLRVKVWRRLQSLGSVPIKNSVYVLPNTDDAREDFEWMRREIAEAGGEASLCEARLVDGLTDEQVRDSFRQAREVDYRALAKDVRELARTTSTRKRSPTAEERARAEAALARFRKRLDDVAKIDFFGAPGRPAVEGALLDLERRLQPSDAARAAGAATRRIQDVRARTWVTRSGVHIDRMASAWLIRRFIDPKARFKFVPSRGYTPLQREICFDMFDADFTHEGDLCTFEVLLQRFGVDDPGLRGVGEIVHDIDLKDARFDRPETSGIDHLVAGIAWMHADDDARLAASASVFDALYTYLGRRPK